MDDNTLKKRLLNYNPNDNNQLKIRDQMLNFLSEHGDCFERSFMPGHFTASAWLLNKAGDSALLMHHAKLKLWLQLGGHCDGNCDVLDVALKEAREESGIQSIEPVSTEIFDLDIHKIPIYKNDPEHLHYDVRFLLQVQSDEPLKANNESDALKWFHFNESLPTNESSVTRMFKKWVVLLSVLNCF